MLLAKACHDVDWLSFVIGRPCRRVSSFGSLSFFKKENQPAGAADRCLDCKLSRKCPWSAKEFYFKRLADPKQHGWPLDVVDPTFTKKNLTKALREGPYGRCVFACDNDVVDHQVVNFEYEGGVTASFTMTAFAPMGGRRTRIFGTKGTIELRKNLNVGTDVKGGDHLFYVNGEKEEYINAKGTTGYPFFGEMILDCLNGTEKAMTQSHILKAAELCIRCQLMAVRVSSNNVTAGIYAK